MNKHRGKIFSDIIQERLSQDRKWGIQKHNPVEWMSILMEEVGEASEKANWIHHRCTSAPDDNTNLDNIRDFKKELTQVAAVAVAILEQYEGL